MISVSTDSDTDRVLYEYRELDVHVARTLMSNHYYPHYRVPSYMYEHDDYVQCYHVGKD